MNKYIYDTTNHSICEVNGRTVLTFAQDITSIQAFSILDDINACYILKKHYGTPDIEKEFSSMEDVIKSLEIQLDKANSTIYG